MATRTNEPFLFSFCNKWDPKSPQGWYSRNTWHGQFVNACMESEHTQTHTYRCSCWQNQFTSYQRAVLLSFLHQYAFISLLAVCCYPSEGPGSVKPRLHCFLEISEALQISHAEKAFNEQVFIMRKQMKSLIIKSSSNGFRIFLQAKADEKKILTQLKTAVLSKCGNQGKQRSHTHVSGVRLTVWNHLPAHSAYPTHLFSAG